MQEAAGSAIDERRENQLQPYPAGFLFHPTGEELVRDYLVPKTEDRPLPFPIPTLDVYGTDPSRLPVDLKYSAGGEIYCFARRTRRTENGSRAQRTVRAPAGEAMSSSGTWHATGKPQGVCVGGRVVAVKRLLSFRRGDSGGGWIMHEYCLEDSTKFQDLVLCMIRNRNCGREEQEPPQLHEASHHATQQEAPKEGAEGEGNALAAAPGASSGTVHRTAACGTPATAPVQGANYYRAVYADDPRSMQLEPLRHFVYPPAGPLPAPPTRSENGNPPGSCPLSAFAGQRPDWPNTAPAFPLIRSRMLIDELPPGTTPEPGMGCRADVYTRRLHHHPPVVLPSSSAGHEQDAAGLLDVYFVFVRPRRTMGWAEEE